MKKVEMLGMKGLSLDGFSEYKEKERMGYELHKTKAS